MSCYTQVYYYELFTYMSYIGNIQESVIKNENFREVIFTGDKSQLVLMCIPVQSEVGEEVHNKVEQTLYIISGVCDVILDHTRTQVTGGDIIVVTPNTRHNFINVGNDPVRIITSYSPPNHIDKRIHKTIEEALGDIDDEKFSEAVNSN